MLHNIGFTISKGEKIGIIGESGSGKSTLIRCLNRLESHNDGQIFIDNQDISKHSLYSLRKNISLKLMM